VKEGEFEVANSGVHSALVTGASSGIGKAMAAALGARGSALTLVGRSVRSLEAVALELTQDTDQPQPRLLQTDLSAPEQVLEAAHELAGHMPKLDVLVHCAAIYHPEPWLSISAAKLTETFTTNVASPMVLTRHLVPALKAAGGTVVFINSSIVRGDGAAAGVYAASKHALRSCADSLRAQVSKDGIRVLSVFPGRTATPLQAEIFRRERRVYHPERLLQPEDVAEAILSALVLPATADLTDLHIRPRCNPLSDFVTD